LVSYTVATIISWAILPGALRVPTVTQFPSCLSEHWKIFTGVLPEAATST
jgi:hypothetical protein